MITKIQHAHLIDITIIEILNITVHGISLYIHI